MRLLAPCLLLVACGGPDATDGPGPVDTDDTDDGWTLPPDTGTDGTPTDIPNAHTDGGAEICVLLFGGSDRVRGPDEGLPMGNVPRTLQAWVRTRHNGEQIAASYGRPSPEQGFLLGTVDGYALFRAGSGSQRLVGETYIADDEWHHLAVSFDGSTAALVVDGEIDGVGQQFVVETLEGDLVAGNTPTGDLTTPWIGWLDDVRLFDFTRNPVDVAADLDGDEAPPGTLLLDWTFEIAPNATGPGLYVPDESGNGHDGETGGADGRPLFLPCR